MSSVKMNNGKLTYSFSVQYEKKSISSLHKTKMFAISKSDYVVACGDHPSSPVATDEEREISRKNEITIKKAIEDVLRLLVTTILNVLMLF